jgi:hypothetical protein
LSEEDNLKRGEWIVFGVWPDTLKCISLLSQVMVAVSSKKNPVITDWREPYHSGRGGGRWGTTNASGSISTV